MLAETKDHADWSLLQQLSASFGDEEARAAVQRVVETIEPQEDEHVEWAKQTMAKLSKDAAENLELPFERVTERLSTPDVPIKDVHPAPAPQSWLLPLAKEPMWAETPVVRAVRASPLTQPKRWRAA